MKKSDKRRSGADVLLLLYYQATSKNLTLFEQMELNVYREIVLRYAMQFMKPETSIVSISTIGIDQGILEYKVSRITDPGWRNGNSEIGQGSI